MPHGPARSPRYCLTPPTSWIGSPEPNPPDSRPNLVGPPLLSTVAGRLAWSTDHDVYVDVNREGWCCTAGVRGVASRGNFAQ